MSEALNRARKKYKENNVKRLTVDFYPTDKEIYEYLQEQPKKQTYIKNLIREDMKRSKK